MCKFIYVCALTTVADVHFYSISALRWRHVYLIFLLGVPCVSAATEILVVIKYDAYKQSKSATFCDVSNPLW